jgi:hypothetical protein
MNARKTRLGHNREHADQESAQTKPGRSLRDRLYLVFLLLIGALYAGITLKIVLEGKAIPDTPPCPPPMEGSWPDCHDPKPH